MWERRQTQRAIPHRDHPSGTAPVIEDDGIVLAETGAIFDYLLAKHGGGTLKPAYGDKDFADYLFWFHFANGTLQPAMASTAASARRGVGSAAAAARMRPTSSSV